MQVEENKDDWQHFAHLPHSREQTNDEPNLCHSSTGTSEVGEGERGGISFVFFFRAQYDALPVYKHASRNAPTSVSRGYHHAVIDQTIISLVNFFAVRNLGLSLQGRLAKQCHDVFDNFRPFFECFIS